MLLNESVQNLTAESKRLLEANVKKESFIKDLQKKLHSCGNNKNQVCGHIQQIVEGKNIFEMFDIMYTDRVKIHRMSNERNTFSDFSSVGGRS